MDNKEAIIQATIKLIEEKGEHLEEVTVREICKRAGVGLGLVNYHFGNKDKLIEQCIERMISHRKKMTTLTELMRHIFRLLQPAVLTLTQRR